VTSSVAGPLRVTLLADGPTDRVLVRVIEWVLRELHLAAVVQWADLRILPTPPTGLAARARKAIELYPAEVLFIHRDAERDSLASRVTEVASALAHVDVRSVCIVPVRMTEAWFLFDERAIREAANNPNGTSPLSLPRITDLESDPDPKESLRSALRLASGQHGRRLARFDTAKAFYRLADRIVAFAPLRRLEAFTHFEDEARRVCVADARTDAADE
jgi:hypothetical protein